MKSNSDYVQWQYVGKADFLVGTGATRVEKMLVLAASSLGIFLYIYLFFTDALVWTWWQYGLATLIAMDVFGGLVANSLNSCKRFYLKRPVAFLVILIALLLNYYLIPVIPGFAWLAPALFIMILYGYLVKEEPYRPLSEVD